MYFIIFHRVCSQHSWKSGEYIFSKEMNTKLFIWCHKQYLIQPRLNQIWECDGQTSGKHPLFLVPHGQSSKVVEQADSGVGWTQLNPSFANWSKWIQASCSFFLCYSFLIYTLEKIEHLLHRLYRWYTNVSHYYLPQTFRKKFYIKCIPKTCDSWGSIMAQLSSTYAPWERTAWPPPETALPVTSFLAST